MKPLDLKEVLKNNTYPGRGIIIGKSSDGENAVIVYFIMGRSENSRNRIFVADGNGMKTKAFDESKMVDPSLIIYSPIRVINGMTIVTNGDQTDTVFDYLKAGKTFEEALRTRTFEPDPPNFTPRISGLLIGSDFKMSILKSNNGDETGTNKYFYEYTNEKAGLGRFIHTYMCDGNPIPTFEGEPELVTLDGDIETLAKNVWESLNSDNKVSLAVRFIDKNGNAETKIINKHN